MEDDKGYWVVYENDGVRWQRRYESYGDFQKKKSKEGGVVVDMGMTKETAEKLCTEKGQETLVDRCLKGLCSNNSHIPVHQRIQSSEPATHFENEF